jgi:hypothetical protein
MLPDPALLDWSDDDSNKSESEEEGHPSPGKKSKPNYDRARRFQLEWQARLPWAEGVLSEDGKLHMVRCRTCTTVDGQEKLLAPKLDTLLKHEGRRRATDCRLCRAKKKRWSLCLSKKVIGRRLIFCEFMH